MRSLNEYDYKILKNQATEVVDQIFDVANLETDKRKDIGEKCDNLVFENLKNILTSYQ